ncbi:MAG: UPF0158 family protein [Nitrososphaerales archaeon]
MPIPVKLSEIILGMESQSDEMHSYLDIKTGEVVTVSDEEFSAANNNEPLENFPEWQRENIELAREILEPDDYLQLPDKFEINEYHILEKFCLSINDEELREQMYYSIKGSGAFRRFKENIRKCGIEDDWYRFRDAKMKEVAMEWCEYHKVPYIDQ